MQSPQILILLLTLSQYGVFFSWSSDSVPKHYCGSSLTDALSSVCKKSGFATQFAPRAESNRTTGGIIEECCKNPCSKDHLSQYCQKKIATIPIKSKRRNDEQFLHFIETNKVSKRKRSPTSVCTCGRRSSHIKKNLRENRKRPTKLQKKKHRLSSDDKNVVTHPTTTEKQFPAEAQYIDDWTGDEGGPPIFLNKH